jgi:hypothetical protein
MERLYKNYDYLLQHSTRGECEKNFKRCGILDTYGNIMCLPDKESCPINEIIIDDVKKQEFYRNKGYNSSFIFDLYYFNKTLYYTNKSINKEIVVDLNFTEDNPKYIYDFNFIFDYNTYYKYYGNNSNNNTGHYEFEEEVLEGIFHENEEISNYIYNKFNESQNVDKYYKKIYNYLYTKNYIGFESYEKMNSFMDMDLHNYYFKKFPNTKSYTFAIVSLIFNFLFILISLCCICCFCCNEPKLNEVGKDKPYEAYANIITTVLIYLMIWIGFFIYVFYAYLKIYNDEEFKEIKKINTDDFISNYIDEINEKIGDNRYILIMLFLLGVSCVCFIIAILFTVCHCFLNRNNENKKGNITRNTTIISEVTNNVTNTSNGIIQ